MEVTNRLKGLDLIERMPEELWTEVCDIGQKTVIKTIPKKKKCKKAKCASKCGNLSSGHRTGKGQFSFQSQRTAMPKNTQTTTQWHSSFMLESNAQNSLSQASTVCEL